METIIGIIGVLAGVVSALFAFWPIWQHRRTQLLLEKSFGSEMYGPETIECSTRYYIPPNCSSVDPAQEAEMRQVEVTEEKLFEKVDKHLAKHNPHRHLLLLADSGMGKSSFVLNYYARNQRLPERKRQRLAVVPLGIPDAEEYIAKIPDPQNTVLFLDAFDEDTRAIKDHRQRLLDLMHACRHFKRVLLTCRTQFFPKDMEIPRETGIIRVEPRKAGEEAIYEFKKLYIAPLSNSQINAFLRRLYPLGSISKRKRARRLVRKIPSLSVRPMLLTYIPDLLESGVQFNYAFQLYEVLIEQWLERESRWVEPETLRQFSERLAVDLFINSQRRRSERIPRSELTILAKEWNISLDEWQLSMRSLLNRDAEGNYKFAHRSIMEYLMVKRAVEGDLNCVGMKWTDLMKAFLKDVVQDSIDKKQPLQIEARHEILRGFQYTLRSKPSSELRHKKIKAMLKQQDFFDIEKSKEGKGIFHLYLLYEKQGEKLVVDYATGLTWQQSGSSNDVTFSDAEKYIHDLNAKCLAGYKDWRLPTLEEGMSLMERERKKGALYIDPIFNHTQWLIWTADNADQWLDGHWTVSFNLGYCYQKRDNDPYVGYYYGQKRDIHAYVRAVR